MSNLDAALAANRDAMAELVAASTACAGVWNVPREPGKWSPSQTVEHVARALEESAHFIAGQPTKFPKLPRFLRALLRRFFFQPALRKQKFSRGKTTRPFNPIAGPETPALGAVRLDGALTTFERACRAGMAGGGTTDSPIFGVVSIVDYALFQAMHTRHHAAQMPRREGVTTA
jgi:hypothetical protein